MAWVDQSAHHSDCNDSSLTHIPDWVSNDSISSDDIRGLFEKLKNDYLLTCESERLKSAFVETIVILQLEIFTEKTNEFDIFESLHKKLNIGGEFRNPYGAMDKLRTLIK